VPNVLRIPRESWGSFIDTKRNIPSVLLKELPRKKQGVIGISTVTDPYQPLERKYQLTRLCLEQIKPYDFPISLQTKSSLICRDWELISAFSDAEVMMSIGTVKDEERRVLEPYASSIDDRLNALQVFAEMGVKTSVFFGPIYPTIIPEDIPEILKRFQEAGAQEVMIDQFNLKPGVLQAVSTRIHHQSGIPISCLQRLINPDWYQQLKHRIHQMGTQYNLKIRDAF
jgi:DNA repair photolyase